MRAIMIGFGTVGQGVCELLIRHRDRYAARLGEPIELAGILVRDAAKPREVAPPPGCVVTDDPHQLFTQPADMLIEVAGGVDTALPHHARALDAGLDIVTANKALVAARGNQLFAHAERTHRRIGIEATVAGGVPILETITTCLAANHITTVAGITNGTCHFIIRAMEQGRDYADALAEAHRIGFAEADPTLDVSGRDSVEKLAIMAALAFGGAVDVDAIPSRGVDQLTLEELHDADEQGMAIRLLGLARRPDDPGAPVELVNGPCLVPKDSPLGRCPADEMAVLVQGDAAPRMLIAGAGAGRFPTASAVVADVLKLAQLRGAREGTLNPWPTESLSIAPAPAGDDAMPVVASGG
ncbi:MAG: homoserine dehydrogenase [Planctomycetota bacterium]